MSEKNGRNAEEFPLPLRPELTDELERSVTQNSEHRTNTSHVEVPRARRGAGSRNGAGPRPAASRRATQPPSAQLASLCNTDDYLNLTFAAVLARPLPVAAEAFRLPGLKMLVGLCRELQESAERLGEGRRFYLSCRAAGRLLGVSHMTASRWLSLLERVGVIACHWKGTKATMRASEYKYLGD